MRHFLQAAMLAGFGLLAASPAARGQVTVDQVLSREHPAFDTAGAHLGPGPDGSVYLGRDGYLMRLDPAGRKTGALFQGRVTALAANSNGVLAAAVAHFTRSVVLFDASFREIGRVSDFLNSDKTEWFAPCDVQAGASGDFYGFDENRDRILRIRPPDRVVQAYSTEGTGEKYAGRILRFRVCEKPGLFYILNEWGQLHALTFEGQKRWTLNTGLVGNPWNGYAGAFDADGDGNLYLLKEGTNTVDILSPDARSTNRLVLAGEPGPGRITALRLLGREILVRRSHPIELFRAYSRDTGKLLRVAKADAERLSATFASRVWTAGAAMPFSITLEKGGAVPAPAFRVFAAPFGTTRWQPLAVTHGQVAVPTNLSGLCQVTVTTDLRPGADDDSGYRLRDVVEIRQPGVSGTVSAWTPSNRVAYAAGEPIPFQAVVRTTNPEPVRIEVRLVSADGGAILFATNAMLKPGELLQAGLPPSLTVALRPGAYALAPTAPGLSAVPQWLEIGARRRSAVADFDRVVYGDYQLLFPKEGRLHQPDAAAAHVRRSVRLGASLFVDRVGSPWAGNIGHVDTWGMDAVGPRKAADARKAMEADPSGPAPDKLDQAPPFQQTVAAYGAAGLSQMALLMNMDAGLPIGQPHDTRKPEEFERDIQRVTRAMGPYAGFRGWTWVANWWVNEDGMAEESQRAAYKLALEQAKATGAWSPILEEVGARKVNYAVEAQARFARALAAVMTNLVTASAGPWRRPEVYPPATFGNVDEVDLHVQGEQMAWPNWYAHAVDWQERPGRRSWGHPELQNDGGTGEQVLPTLWTLAMRGADGIGSASSIPPWQNADRWVDDPRSPASGAASVFRSAFQLFKAYGPWLSTLEKRDPVLIPVSRRMVLLDGWTDTLGGEYFSRLFRAQQTCLYAKRPASFVFAEDLKPGMLESAKAILVVGQTVAFDPEWPAALKAAADRGVPIFYDASCRTNLVASFRPLDLSFARGELDPFYWQCDSAYGFLPEYFRGQAPRLERSLEQAGVAAVAAIPEREVLATERVSEGGRFLVVVNNTIQPVAMGLFWRQNLYAATRVPLVADVTIPGAEGQAVYDVLAMKRVDAPGGLVKADLRSTGARLYAVLPQPVGGVAIQTPGSVKPGSEAAYVVSIKGTAAALPVRIRMREADGAVLAETFEKTAVPGAFTVPVNVRGPRLVLEATELVSGQRAEATVAIEGAKAPPDAAPVPADPFRPMTRAFGPRVRDLVVSTDGSRVLLNAMNWDDNVYALDAATGAVQGRGRVGHAYAFSPVATDAGFWVEGFDFTSPEGYQLYRLGRDGGPVRRFTQFGLPHRGVGWCSALGGPARGSSFVVSKKGAWAASAGDLGLVMWTADGKERWRKDWTAEYGRSPLQLAALGDDAVVLARGRTLSAFAARDGRELWSIEPADTGELVLLRASADGRSVAVASTALGGRIYVVRDGKVEAVMPAPAKDFALADDGSVAVVNNDRLSLFAKDGSLAWTFKGDDILWAPRFSPNGGRLSCGSELGTLVVLDLKGELILERDLEAMPRTAWLPDGGLIAATWAGRVFHFDGSMNDSWEIHLAPAGTANRLPVPEPENLPTARAAGWGNAEAAPAPMVPNLFATGRVSVAAFHVPFAGGDPEPLQNPVDALFDGKADPLPKPWLDWKTVNHIDSGWKGSLAIEIDTRGRQVRLDGLTIHEDPAHPESWIRDVRLQTWDAVQERWVDGPVLLADAQVHTHRFVKPLEGSRFRLVSTGGGTWPSGNLRLTELVAHGAEIGPAHPDLLAARPVAVLFEDRGGEIQRGFGTDALELQPSGGRDAGPCLLLKRDGLVMPYLPWHSRDLPGWEFPISEHPKPGQYRWLQFSWKGRVPGVSAISLRAGPALLTAGGQDWKPGPGVTVFPVASEVPSEWSTVRVDLWAVLKKEEQIRTIGFGAIGGALFDGIRLGRTEADLPPVPKTGSAPVTLDDILP